MYIAPNSVAETADDKIVCERIEALLNAATGRCPVGSISDVLRRVVSNSTFFSIATAVNPVEDSDVKELAQAIWCVLVSKDVDSPLATRGTLPGISVESSRYDFVRQHASDFVYEASVPGITPTFNSLTTSPHPEESVRRFEEYLVSIVALYRIDTGACECFSVSAILPKLRVFFMAIEHPDRMSNVCEHLLHAMATVEEVSMVYR